MSELTVTLLRLGYLALLWFLVLSAITVLRRDLYGTRIIDRRRPAKAQPSGDAAAVPAGEAPRPALRLRDRPGSRHRNDSGPLAHRRGEGVAITSVDAATIRPLFA